MQPRIVFLVMSAVSKPQTVDQLVRALDPHVALVHHDFSQTPVFPLAAPNVRWVPDPRRTGWAHFGFVEGIFHSLRHALETLDFDYLQLLSPSCLPVKPLAGFEQHVAGGAQAHFDCVDLLADRDALMSVGYRAFTPQHSLKHRIARRATSVYFGDSTGRRDEAGIWLRSGRGRGVLASAAGAFIESLARPSASGHPFDASFRPYYGTAWFGARRDVVRGMVAMFEAPGIREYFSRLRIPEEFLFPSMLMKLAGSKGPMNHVHKKFEGARTGTFDVADMNQLRRSAAWFGRKFPDDPDADIRQWVLRELVGTVPVPDGAQPVRNRAAAADTAARQVDHGRGPGPASEFQEWREA